MGQAYRSARVLCYLFPLGRKGYVKAIDCQARIGVPEEPKDA
jgi:hypothetical protein